MGKINQATARIVTGDALDVRSFTVTQAMSQLFRVELRVVSTNLDLDFDAILGNEASFSLGSTVSARTYSGICVELDQVRVDRRNLATYTLVIAPRAHLLTQRKNYRVFQYKSELDIVRQLLDEWRVPHRVMVDPASHKPRKFRVQYAETDFAFASRMLEDAGISYYFEDSDGETRMVLDDEPQSREVGHARVRHFDEPGVSDVGFVTAVSMAQRVRPGKVAIGDLDYRRASTQQPRLSASGGLPQECALEHFDYEPGAFLYQCQAGGSSPSADDRGVTRTDEQAGQRKTRSRLLAKRQDTKRLSFETNLLELSPGSILSIADHPHPSVEADPGWLVTGGILEGDHDGDWRLHVDAVGTELPFRPMPLTPKPLVRGLESATVVGPPGEEIHTDEYGRVRVHFHWDRESKRDQESSCWLPTSQPWAGAGFGGVVLPRVGQEVLVEFLGGDPDRPVVVGRVFTEHQPPPYPLPEGKTITGIVGKSTPAMVIGASGTEMRTYDFQDVFAQRWSEQSFAAVPPRAFSSYNTSNAFLLGDAQGGDITFLQAARDFNILAKNAWTSLVGNYRGGFVGGNDILHVRNKQQIDVGQDQVLRVRRDQHIDVRGRREERVDKDVGLKVLSDLTMRSAGEMDFLAGRSIVIESDEMIRLEVGASSITVTKSSVVIASARVDINPES